MPVGIFLVCWFWKGILYPKFTCSLATKISFNEHPLGVYGMHWAEDAMGLVRSSFPLDRE